jgi:hypothetical protein
MKISVTSSGSYNKTEAYLRRLTQGRMFTSMSRHGETGRAALANATPVDSGKTASSWGYRVSNSASGWQIEWFNTDNENGFPVAIMLQYGHGTGTGGYVQGRDYINPAIKPVFDKIAEAVWEEVTRS